MRLYFMYLLVDSSLSQDGVTALGLAKAGDHKDIFRLLQATGTF